MNETRKELHIFSLQHASALDCSLNLKLAKKTMSQGPRIVPFIWLRLLRFPPLQSSMTSNHSQSLGAREIYHTDMICLVQF